MILDHYTVLGLNPTASPADIEASWRRFAASVHPDGKPEHEKEKATQLFAEFSVRYAVLRDPAKRAAYNAGLRAAREAEAAAARPHSETFNVTAVPSATAPSPFAALRNDAVANFEFFLRNFDEAPFLSALGLFGSGVVAFLVTVAEIQEKQRLEELERQRRRRELEITLARLRGSSRSRTRSAKRSSGPSKSKRRSTSK